jgi:hypothetical protein
MTVFDEKGIPVDARAYRYFILRRGDPWRVFTRDVEKRYVCEFPAGEYDSALTEAVCFAADDAAVVVAIEAFTSAPGYAERMEIVALGSYKS